MLQRPRRWGGHRHGYGTGAALPPEVVHLWAAGHRAVQPYRGNGCQSHRHRPRRPSRGGGAVHRLRHRTPRPPRLRRGRADGGAAAPPASLHPGVSYLGRQAPGTAHTLPEATPSACIHEDCAHVSPFTPPPPSSCPAPLPLCAAPAWLRSRCSARALRDYAASPLMVDLDRRHSRCPRLGHLHTQGYALFLWARPDACGAMRHVASSALHTPRLARLPHPHIPNVPSSPHHPRHRPHCFRTATTLPPASPAPPPLTRPPPRRALGAPSSPRHLGRRTHGCARLPGGRGPRDGSSATDSCDVEGAGDSVGAHNDGGVMRGSRGVDPAERAHHGLLLCEQPRHG